MYSSNPIVRRRTSVLFLITLYHLLYLTSCGFRATLISRIVTQSWFAAKQLLHSSSIFDSLPTPVDNLNTLSFSQSFMTLGTNSGSLKPLITFAPLKEKLAQLKFYPCKFSGMFSSTTYIIYHTTLCFWCLLLYGFFHASKSVFFLPNSREIMGAFWDGTYQADIVPCRICYRMMD